MNNFTTETIINTDLFSAANGVLKVKKVGNYKAADVVSVHKQPGSNAVKEIVAITIPAGLATKTYRLQIIVKQVGANVSEFANSLTRNNKILQFEVAGSTTAATMATALEAAIKAYNRDSKNAKCTVSLNTATLTLTGVDEYIRFASVEFHELAESVTGYDSFEVKATGTVSTPGSEGFGTPRWILKNLRMPTLENTGWTALHQDERPIPGGLYTQYSLKQAVKRGELQGMGAVGQEMTSVTTHVFYVLTGAVSAALEAACATAGIQIDTVNKAVSAVTLGNSGNVSVTDAALATGVQLTYTTTPAGVTGAIFARRPAGDVDASGSGANFTKVTVSPTGLVKLASGHGIAATDSVGITVTIDGSEFPLVLTMVA